MRSFLFAVLCLGALCLTAHADCPCRPCPKTCTTKGCNCLAERVKEDKSEPEKSACWRPGLFIRIGFEIAIGRHPCHPRHPKGSCR